MSGFLAVKPFYNCNMENLFAKIIILAGVGMVAGCQTDRGAQAAAGASPGSRDKTVFSEPPQIPAASSDIGQSGLIPREQAQQTLKNFKEAYLKLGSPRFLIFMNSEVLEVLRPTAGENLQRSDDIKQVFAKPLRVAGAALADQKTADALMAGKWLKAPNASGDAEAARDRDSLRKIADVGIEILIAPSDEVAKGNSTDKTVSIPEIQATAIRLEDARIIGQASTSNLQARERQFDVRDASEAVALLLMEDLVREAK